MSQTDIYLHKFRFGFEYEILIEPDDVYHKLCKHLERLVDNRDPRVMDICNGLFALPPTNGYLTQQDMKDPFVRKLMKSYKIQAPPEKFIPRLVLASMYNAQAKRKLFFMNNKVSTSDCEGVPVNLDTSDIIQQRTNSYRSPEQKIWRIVDDSSVTHESRNILYGTTSDFLAGNIVESIPELVEQIEIVSPILSYSDFSTPRSSFNRIMNDVFPVKGLRYWNNEKTSNHVHISYDDPELIQPSPNKTEFISKVCIAWWWFEPVWMSFVTSWRKNNRYCREMRKIAIMDAFGTIQKSVKRLKKGLNKDLVQLYMLIHMFQGDIGDKGTRYAAFNLLNMVEGGIQTVEVRIKQGSTDANENRMFMMLLAHFFHAVLSSPSVATLLTEPEKDVLMEGKDKKKMTDIFWNFVGNRETEQYWRTMQERIAVHSQRGGGSMRMSKESEIQVTSFGVVDYKKLRESVCTSAEYQAAKELVNGHIETATQYTNTPISSTRLVQTMAGGKKKYMNNK
jgi:hypothetical protein